MAVVDDGTDDTKDVPATSVVVSTKASTASLTDVSKTSMVTANPSLKRSAETMNVATEPIRAYSQQPWLPNKTGAVPKAALSAWYSQKPRSHQISKDCYVTWHDGGLAHQLKFTSVFVCPLTGETFASGRYGESSSYTTMVDKQNGTNVVWYTKKTLAEHGAASRAYDCFSFREYFGTGMQSVHLGMEQPYLAASQAQQLGQSPPPPLPTLPPEVQAKVTNALETHNNRRNEARLAQVDLNEYREARKTMGADNDHMQCDSTL